MHELELIGWSLAAAATAWGLTVWWANLALAHLRRSMQSEVEYWKGEAARASEVAVHLRHEIATWSQGARQGRDDVIALMPLLVAAHQRLTAETASGMGQAD
jgi:hypothetical protein